jgi:two-component system NtrC family response regulator
MAHRILLVDDNTELLVALTKILEKEGYTITAKPDVESALEYLWHAPDKPDLIITDISLPGLKGTDLLTTVARDWPHLPVILITAFGEWDQYMDALRAGAFAYLPKPLDKTELLATVGRALSR